MIARKKHEEKVELPAPSTGWKVAWMVLFGVWLFMAAAFISFDGADPPSHAAAPWNDPVGNWCGSVGAFLAYHAYFVFGIGVWLILVGTAAMLAITSTGRTVNQLIIRSIGLLLMAFTFSAMHSQIAPNFGPLPSTQGGLFAVYIVTELTHRFNPVGTFLCVLIAFGIGAVIAIDELILALPRFILASLKATGKLRIPGLARARLSIPGFGSIGANEALKDEKSSRGKKKKKGLGPIDPDAGGVGATDAFDPEDHELDDDEYEDDEEEEEEPKRKSLTREELRQKIAKLPLRMAGRSTKVAQDDDIPREENFEGYKFPPLELLEDPETNYSEKMEKFVRKQAEVLEETLQTYGIDGEVTGIDSGPVVTLYSVELAPGTKVSKVTAVSSDVARSLRAQNVRIVPNMAGRSAIGIEVPNLHKERVRLKELMSGGHAEKMRLPMFLGKDASGEPLVADLTRMPHMLIAGTTGSGKSVCMNSIIMSWLYTKRPDELKLVLVDPKMVELSQFQNIPHLMCPVVTEMGRATAILEWAVKKMEERYELLSEAVVRDVSAYNELTEEELYERFDPQNDYERARIPKKLPYMVFIVDELADLIMTCKEVEHSVVRIAQKARAVGIHLILATQRPQANVVTGLIKSNMPCRVSFKVASGMDSRIVLDQKGAELLLGQGDMMFLAPHSAEINRAQGTLVTDVEIRKVAKFLKEVAAPSFERSLIAIRPGGNVDPEGLAVSERDPMFDEAVKIMIESGRGSVSLLQRRLAIGYSRASRLVDQMGLAGILGEHKGSVARDVLITLDEWEEMKLLEEQQEADGTLFEADKENSETEDDGFEEFDNLDEENAPVVETFDVADGDSDEDEDEEWEYEYVDEEEEQDDSVPAEFGDEFRQ